MESLRQIVFALDNVTFCPGTKTRSSSEGVSSPSSSSEGRLQIVALRQQQPTRYCLIWAPSGCVDGRVREEQDEELEEGTDDVEEALETASSSDAGTEGGEGHKRLLVHLEDVASFRLGEQDRPMLQQHLVIIERDGKTHRPLIFDDGDRQGFLEFISSVISIRPSLSDPSLYLVFDAHQAELDDSLAKLQLLECQRDDTIWKFVREMKKDPYSTAMTAFSKLTDKFIFSSMTDANSPDSVLMLQSFIMSNCEEGVSSKPSDDDFEVILTKAKLVDDLELRDRGEPLGQCDWEQYQQPDGVVSNEVEVKQRIFDGGIDHSVRSTAWKFLLGVIPWSMTHEEGNLLRQQQVKEYFRMKLQWKSMTPEQEKNFTAFRERKSQIEKDTVRTDRNHVFFEGDGNANVVMLFEILMTAVMHDFDLGYVQGMSDLLAPILFVMRNEVDAFWCFAGFMKRVRDNFDLEHGGMKKQLMALSDLVQVIDPELYAYLVAKESDNFFFCFRWLLIWFKRELGFEDVMKLWEILWTGLPCKNFHLLICVSLLHMEKSVIIENKFGFSEILKHINDKSHMINLDKVLQHAEALHRKLESEHYVNGRIQQLLT